MNEEMSKRRAEGIARMIGNPGVLSKGSTPWNKGVRGYMGGNRTSFTKETATADKTKKGVPGRDTFLQP